MEYYHQFQNGAIEAHKKWKKILFPAAQKANDGAASAGSKAPPESCGAYGADGSATTDDVIKVIRHVLEKHDLLEEEPGGMYDLCEKTDRRRNASIAGWTRKVTKVPVLPPNKTDFALDVAKRTLERAGV